MHSGVCIAPQLEPEEGKAKVPLVIVVEAAILVEAQWDNLFDEIWVVTVPQQVALARLMERNKLTSDAAQQRIDAQISSDERLKHGHVEIINDCDLKTCCAKVDAEFEKLGGRYNRGGSALDEVEVPSPEGVESSGLVAKTVKRGTMRAFNLWHKATSIVMIHEPTKKLYVQKRSSIKDYCPGMLDPTPGKFLLHNNAHENKQLRPCCVVSIGSVWRKLLRHQLVGGLTYL
jgi:hypothetical protein